MREDLRLVRVCVGINEKLDVAFLYLGTKAVAYDVGALGGVHPRRECLHPVSIRATTLDDLRLEQR